MWKKIRIGLLVFLGFLIVSLIFYGRAFWYELIVDSSKIGALYGEFQATEWGMQNIYDNLMEGKNPFIPIKSILYPFGIDVVGADAGFAFNFLFFRPFFSAHQSLMMTMIVSLLMANIGMYLLLRAMGFDRLTSFMLGLAYGNSTYLIIRHGHPGYFIIYLFPWLFYSTLTFINTKKILLKLLTLFLIPLLLVMTLWQNMYYFIILIIGCASFGLYFLIFKRKQTFKFINQNIIFLFFILILTLILLIPWLKVLYETLIFSETPKGLGWNGAIEFSSDLIGIFIPSSYNYYYGKFISIFGKDIAFIRDIFENYTYPGLILLITYIWYLIFIKRIPKKIKQNIHPYFLISLVYFVLTLGPFLHIFGNWFITIEENIRLVFPLPFIFIHYIPFIGNIRAPGRLIIGFIFLAYIVCAYIIKYFLKNKSFQYKIVFFIVLFSVFFIDHRPVSVSSDTTVFYPKNIFSYIQKDKSKFSVLEIPFTLRDGFTYFGDYNSINMTVGQSYYNKPFIGGYSGRIPDYVKRYYKNNPMIGYIGRLIDKDLKNNPSMINDNIEEWKKPNIKDSNEVADFLDIKYIIVDMSKVTNKDILTLLDNLGYKNILKEKSFNLFVRIPSNKEFYEVLLDNLNNSILLAMGWSPLEVDYRWAERRSSILFKTNRPRDLVLKFKSSTFYTNQKMTVYINQKKISSFMTYPGYKDYQVDLNKHYVKKGINTVHFIMEKSYKPSDVIVNSQDDRKLAVQFKKIWIEEKN